MKTRIIILAAAAIVAVSCKSGSSDKAAAPVADAVKAVTVVSADYQTVPQVETYSSTIEAYVKNNIVSQSAGRIRKINVEVGDYVTKGQILAEMDRLQLEQARLKLINDSTDLVRVKSLYEQGGVSQSDFESINMAYEVSKTSYDNLVENTILRSPVAGVVTARNYDANDMYAMSLPIFTVQQITPVKVFVPISESSYTDVKKGDKVSIETEAIPGRKFVGSVVRIHPTIDAATHTFQAEVVVENKDKVLRPGMYAKVSVTFSENSRIVIPDSAVLKMQGAGQKYVFVVDETSRAQMRNITVGRIVGNNYEVLSGLEKGDKVVVSGNSALKSGALVEIK